MKNKEKVVEIIKCISIILMLAGLGYLIYMLEFAELTDMGYNLSTISVISGLFLFLIMYPPLEEKELSKKK